MKKIRRHHKIILTPKAKVLKSLREKRKLSTREVAAKLGFTGSYICQIENGRANVPTGERLIKFLDLYGIKPKYFSQLAKEWKDEGSDLGNVCKLVSSLGDNETNLIVKLISSLASGKLNSNQVQILDNMLEQMI